MKEYIDRLFDKELDFYLKTTGAILVVGPKCIFRIIPAKHLGNCRPLPKGR